MNEIEKKGLEGLKEILKEEEFLIIRFSENINEEAKAKFFIELLKLLKGFNVSIMMV